MLILAGGYTAFWFIAAGKIEQSVGEWAEQARAQKINASWKGLRIGGFPFSFTIDMNDAVLRDEAINPAGRDPPASYYPPARIPGVSGSGIWRRRGA